MVEDVGKMKIASFIAVALILIGVVGSIATFKMPTNRADWRTLDEEFAIEQIENIIIAADNANIEVLPYEGQTVKINVSGRAPENDVVTSVEEETLVIRLKHPKNRLFQFDFFSSVSSLKVYVPEKEFTSIHIESDNGRIVGEGFVAGEIRVKTDNGLIELKDLKGDHISAEADNGKITFEDVEGTVYGETDNGAITFITDNLDRNIDLTTNIGMIEIKTSVKPTNVEILATVDLGSISIFGHSNGSTIFGDGENQIKLTTDIGKIKVK